ncbi:transglutaminase family protein [Desulfurobacterium sp.]
MNKFKVRRIVFVLAFLAALTGAAVTFPFVPLPVLVFFLLSSIFAVWREFKSLKGDVVDRRILNVLALTGMVLLLSKISLENLIIPITSILMFLLSVKFIEDKKSRDFYQMLALSLFQFAAGSVFLFSIRFLFLFVLEAFLIISATVLLSFQTLEDEIVLSVKELGYIFGFSVVFFFVSLPLTLFFFFVLPRTETPLVDIGMKSQIGVTGFTNTVAPGQVSSIQQIDTVFMRVKTEKLPFSPYFRAITYERFINCRWFHIPLNSEDRETVKGRTVRETVILEPYGYRNLPMIDVPLSIGLKNVRRDNGCFFLNRPVTERIRYGGISVLTDIIKERLSKRERSFYLQLPDMPEVRKFVKKMFGNVSKADMPEAILVFFRRNFSYTLDNLPSSVENFLFKDHRGSCEYFASAAAIIFRLKGIPARLVGGFYGGEYNPYGGYYIVKDKNAHVWVEYYEDGGWHRFEPTFGQIGKAKRTGNRRQAGADGGRINLPERMRLILDALNYYWINFVINYDFSMQIQAAMKMRTRFPEIFRLTIRSVTPLNNDILIYIISLGLMLFLFVLFIKTRRTVIDEFYDLMGQMGYERLKNEPLEVFVKRIDDENLRKKAEEFVKIYEEKFYRDEPVCCVTVDRLRNILKNLKEDHLH